MNKLNKLSKHFVVKYAVLLAAFILTTSILFAQKATVQSAYQYLKYEQLDKAKESIDQAVMSESTMNNEKAWYYRGLIYQSLYKNEKFPNLSSDPLGEALKSYNKALEINPKFEYAEDLLDKKKTLGKQFADKGYDDFMKKEFAMALTSFENVMILNPADTAIIYNAAISADRSKNNAKAKEYYGKLVDIKYNESKIYQPYAQLLLADKDTAKALDVLNKGVAHFPAEKSILIAQTNIYISSGKTTEALAAIDQAISKDNTNASLYFAKGTLCEKVNKENDAVLAYKKAFEIKTDYFDAYYNLGALFFNQGAKMANAANTIKDNTQYAKAKKEFESKFNEAKPYLEKALELSPKDQSTLVSLKQLYATVNDTVNYERVKKILDGFNK